SKHPLEQDCLMTRDNACCCSCSQTFPMLPLILLDGKNDSISPRFSSFCGSAQSYPVFVDAWVFRELASSPNPLSDTFLIHLKHNRVRCLTAILVLFWFLTLLFQRLYLPFV